MDIYGNIWIFIDIHGSEKPANCDKPRLIHHLRGMILLGEGLC